jgi:hypothetical protein
MTEGKGAQWPPFLSLRGIPSSSEGSRAEATPEWEMLSTKSQKKFESQRPKIKIAGQKAKSFDICPGILHLYFCIFQGICLEFGIRSLAGVILPNKQCIMRKDRNPGVFSEEAWLSCRFVLCLTQ